MFSEAEVELLMNCYYTPFIIYGIAADAPKRKREGRGKESKIEECITSLASRTEFQPHNQIGPVDILGHCEPFSYPSLLHLHHAVNINIERAAISWPYDSLFVQTLCQ
jgi:hypothetical protein